MTAKLEWRRCDPLARWNKIAEKALRFGMTMSTNAVAEVAAVFGRADSTVMVVHVDSGDDDAVETMWHDMVLVPLRKAGLPEQN